MLSGIAVLPLLRTRLLSGLLFLLPCGFGQTVAADDKFFLQRGVVNTLSLVVCCPLVRRPRGRRYRPGPRVRSFPEESFLRRISTQK